VTNERIEKAKTEIEKKLAYAKADAEKGFADVKAEVEKAKAEVEKKMAHTKADLDKAKADVKAEAKTKQSQK
jgi:F0F1-type ATP synthase membrane subunit b/b'